MHIHCGKIKKDVIMMLNALGVIGCAHDPLLDMVVFNVKRQVKNETNRTDIPEELKNVVVCMAVGEYLSMKKVSGQLEGIDLDAAIKQIQEGDTSIQYSVGDGSSTPEQRLDTLINSLLGRKQELHRFRRLVW